MEEETAAVSQETDDASAPVPPKKVKKDPYAALRDVNAASSTSQSTGNLSCEEELSKYKALLVPADIHGPLSFWKHHCQDFPILAETSRRLLCISASSAQSERDFSSVGRTITDVRSRISSSKVEATELLRWGLRAKLLSLS
jgi:hAT family C-terminal dimerisation region